MIGSSEFGTLGPIVEVVGWLVSSSAAISFAWRRRAAFEPSEVDIPKAPERVGGLLTAVLLGLLFSQYSDASHTHLLVNLAIYTASSTLLALLLYGILVSSLTFEVEGIQEDRTPVRIKIIGGLWQTANARNQLRQREGLTTQRYLAGCRYDPDAVWPKGARALAKQAFVLSYLLLTVCGTLALACSAILLLLKTRSV
jgi:hypothetical protein